MDGWKRLQGSMPSRKSRTRPLSLTMSAAFTDMEQDDNITLSLDCRKALQGTPTPPPTPYRLARRFMELPAVQQGCRTLLCLWRELWLGLVGLVLLMLWNIKVLNNYHDPSTRFAVGYPRHTQSQRRSIEAFGLRLGLGYFLSGATMISGAIPLSMAVAPAVWWVFYREHPVRTALGCILFPLLPAAVYALKRYRDEGRPRIDTVSGEPGYPCRHARDSEAETLVDRKHGPRLLEALDLRRMAQQARRGS